MRSLLPILLVSFLLVSCDSAVMEDPDLPVTAGDDAVELAAGKKGRGGGGGGGSASLARFSVVTHDPGHGIGAAEVFDDYGADQIFPAGQDNTTFFGCPDNSRPCAEVTMVWTNIADQDVVGVKHAAALAHPGCDAGTSYPEDICLWDPDLDNSFRARGYGQFGSYAMPGYAFGPANAAGERTATFFWQGQKTRYTDVGNVRKWYVIPGNAYYRNYHTFSFTWQRGGDGLSGIRYSDCTVADPCWADFGTAGPTAPNAAHFILDELTLTDGQAGGGRGKKATAGTPPTVSFDIQAFTDAPAPGFSYTDAAVEDSNLPIWTKMLLTKGGEKDIMPLWSVGVDPGHPTKPGIWNTRFNVGLDRGDGCYTLDLLEGAITNAGASATDDRETEYFWDSSAAPISLALTVSGSSVSLGC